MHTTFPVTVGFTFAVVPFYTLPLRLRWLVTFCCGWLRPRLHTTARLRLGWLRLRSFTFYTPVYHAVTVVRYARLVPRLVALRYVTVLLPLHTRLYCTRFTHSTQCVTHALVTVTFTALPTHAATHTHTHRFLPVLRCCTHAVDCTFGLVLHRLVTFYTARFYVYPLRTRSTVTFVAGSFVTVTVRSFCHVRSGLPCHGSGCSTVPVTVHAAFYVTTHHGWLRTVWITFYVTARFTRSCRYSYVHRCWFTAWLRLRTRFVCTVYAHTFTHCHALPHAVYGYVTPGCTLRLLRFCTVTVTLPRTCRSGFTRSRTFTVTGYVGFCVHTRSRFTGCCGYGYVYVLTVTHVYVYHVAHGWFTYTLVHACVCHTAVYLRARCCGYVYVHTFCGLVTCRSYAFGLVTPRLFALVHARSTFTFTFRLRFTPARSARLPFGYVYLPVCRGCVTTFARGWLRTRFTTRLRYTFAHYVTHRTHTAVYRLRLLRYRFTTRTTRTLHALFCRTPVTGLRFTRLRLPHLRYTHTTVAGWLGLFTRLVTLDWLFVLPHVGCGWLRLRLRLRSFTMPPHGYCTHWLRLRYRYTPFYRLRYTCTRYVYGWFGLFTATVTTHRVTYRLVVTLHCTTLRVVWFRFGFTTLRLRLPHVYTFTITFVRLRLPVAVGYRYV